MKVSFQQKLYVKLVLLTEYKLTFNYTGPYRHLDDMQMRLQQ